MDKKPYYQNYYLAGLMQNEQRILSIIPIMIYVQFWC